MRRGSVTFWAWTASIIVHVIILTVFAVAKFSRSKAVAEQRPAPTARVTRVKELVQTPLITPKPKVKKPRKTTMTKTAKHPQPITRIFNTKKPDPVSSDLTSLSRPAAAQSISPQTSRILPAGVEFFGSYTKRRKICYVVDCSGSMHGIFNRVRKELTKSIQTLQQDQYFYIIFFGSGRLFEFGNGKLLRAMQKNKSAAYDFINSIKPAGQTNALMAIERAVKIRDTQGRGPSVIYFLTDGFELTTEAVQEFSNKVTNLQKRFVPMTKINTIGFWSQNNDRKLLQKIAQQSGGEAVFITDDNRWKDGL